MSKRGENIRKRKDGRWEGRFIIGYNENGFARYHSVYARTYYECKEKLFNARTVHTDRRFNKSSGENIFQDCLYLWLADVKVRLRPQTYAKYLTLAENHILPELGILKIPEVDATVLNQFLDDKLNRGRLDGEGGLAVSSIRIIASILRSVMAYAASEKKCGPMTGELHLPSRKKPRAEVLTMEEQRKLEAHLLSDLDYSGLGVLLSLFTGLRIGEVCGLKWNDIDFKNSYMHISRTVQRIKKISRDEKETKTELRLGMPKTLNSDRIVPIPHFILELLLKMYSDKTSVYVIPGRTRAFMEPRTLQYRFKHYLEACGIRHVNFHVLRHTFATRCMEVGVDIKNLSEILGHSSVNITLNTYVHSSMELKKQQMELLQSVRCL